VTWLAKMQDIYTTRNKTRPQTCALYRKAKETNQRLLRFDFFHCPHETFCVLLRETNARWSNIASTQNGIKLYYSNGERVLSFFPLVQIRYLVSLPGSISRIFVSCTCES